MAGVLPDSMNINTMNLSTNKGTASPYDLPLFQEWAYDFERNEFALNDEGLPYLVQGNEALKVWLYWAIVTERYRYSANSNDYGSEINSMIGMSLSRAIKSSELQRTIRESIEQCPYITNIDHIGVTIDEDLVVVDVNVESIYRKGWVSVSVTI